MWHEKTVLIYSIKSIIIRSYYSKLPFKRKNMIKTKVKTLFVGSLILFTVAAFCQFYESRYSGMLPVITYPLQAYALPLALLGAVLMVLALILQKTSVK